MTSLKIRRNDPCSCQSGKKYKHCCLAQSSSGEFAGAALESAPPEAVSSPLEQGLAAHRAGDLETAATIYKRILEPAPTNADALHLLGLIEFQRGANEAALRLIEAAIRQSRHDPRYFYNLGTVLMALGRPQDAAIQFAIAIGMNPGDAFAHGNLGAALCEAGQRKAAIASFRAALALMPEDVDTWANLCVTYIEEGLAEEAAACLEQALNLNPASAKALNNIGLALQKSGDAGRAAAYFAGSIELDPRNAKALINLGKLALENPLLDDPELGINCLREALAIDPDNHINHSTLLMALQYSARVTPDQLFDEHLRYATRFELPLANTIEPHRNDRNPERRLKIGYVSADLYHHAVATFIFPILSRHDREQFDVYCYYNNDRDDWMSARLKAQVDRWVPCKGQSDAALVERIRADGIDILIDLSGHSVANRLLTFANRPAPLQASWIGYPGTTGLRAVDYYFADRYWLPAGVCDAQFTEKIVRLPVTSVTPFPDAPDVSRLPALRNGRVTFGSFNQLHKFTAEVIAMWSALLRAAPDATLLLGAMPPLDRLDGLIAQFAAHGIEQSRLQFHERCDMHTYLRLHQEVDICLDTAPYSGGTTTVHALWMGVPTLTLAGKTAAGRQGCGLPRHLDLMEFVADDATDFVAKGLAAIANLPALALTRSQLRQRFADSPVCSAAAATDGLERALRTMWRRWCSGQAPVSFDVPI